MLKWDKLFARIYMFSKAFVNLIIHADYLMDAGVLKVIKRSNGFEFTNPGILKFPLEDIYRGGNSRSRNPHMRTMLRMVGFGDNAGSGFPSILATWKEEGWVKPELIEDTALNQVTLYLKMISEYGEKSAKKVAEKSAEMQEVLLSVRQKQIFECMELEVLYKTEEIAEKIGLKGPRTRQLLNELVAMGRLTCTAATKNRRYIRIE